MTNRCLPPAVSFSSFLWQLEDLQSFTYQIKKDLSNSKLINFFDVTFSLQDNRPSDISLISSFTYKDKTNQIDPVETQEKIASLRSTFDIVCDISRSTKNSLITKQELFHYILANNLEIEETGNDELIVNVTAANYTWYFLSYADCVLSFPLQGR